MTLDELDKALQAQGWSRTDRRTWVKWREDGAGMAVKLVRGPEPWELSTAELSGWKRRYFVDARDVLEAVS